MKFKFGVLDKLKILKVLVENQTRKKWRELSDGDEKYNFRNFNVFCKENGIIKQITTPYTPKKNGIIEKMNQLLKMCNCFKHKK
jgi:hypothetical protein